MLSWLNKFWSINKCRDKYTQRAWDVCIRMGLKWFGYLFDWLFWMVRSDLYHFFTKEPKNEVIYFNPYNYQLCLSACVVSTPFYWLTTFLHKILFYVKSMWWDENHCISHGCSANMATNSFYLDQFLRVIININIFKHTRCNSRNFTTHCPPCPHISAYFFLFMHATIWGVLI